MIPPDSPCVSDLESLEEVSELAAPVAMAAERLRLVTEAAEAQKSRAVGELRHALLHLGCTAAALDPKRRDKLAQILYWGQLDIPVRDLVVSLGYADQRSLQAAAGPVDTGVACRRCATPLLATSRSRLAEVQKAGAGRSYRYDLTTCPPCRDAQASAEQWDWDEVEEPWGPPDWPWDDDAGDIRPMA